MPCKIYQNWKNDKEEILNPTVVHDLQSFNKLVNQINHNAGENFSNFVNMKKRVKFFEMSESEKF